MRYYNSYVGNWSNIELIYSTPSMYIDAVHAEGLSYTTKHDDMFPYADDKVSYWTGFFTSRPNSKEYIRRAQHTLLASSKLFSLNMLNQAITDVAAYFMRNTTEEMLDVVGVNQHHDAVTGTAKTYVNKDYARLIFNGIE
jgi:hypothetical protein